MKKDTLFLIAGLLVIFLSLATCLETVWVRDVTEHFEADKRGLGDHDLPDKLTFYLRRGLDDLTLNLMRNYDIDPNADIYIVQELKNGQSFLAKTNDAEKEAVAYYQDVDNMAYMTVRCAPSSNYRSIHECDRVINGNVRIGDGNYDLRPVDSDLPTGQIPNVNGKRYFLLDHANAANKVPMAYTADTRSTNIEDDIHARIKRFREKEKQSNDSPHQYKEAKDQSRKLRHDYYVKIAVLIDSGVYDLYASSLESDHSDGKSKDVRLKIREAYSHIINGVNLRYKTIEDPSLSITIILQHFTIFQRESLFPHKRSKVITNNGKKYINAHPYHDDIKQWVRTNDIDTVPTFDHAMLFTGYELYTDSIENHLISGLSDVKGVCDEVARASLVQSGHYSRTVLTATHELGHNLGANHDGTEDANNCNPDEKCIMYYNAAALNDTTPYSRNAWIFSTCSVESFKKTLVTRDCVKVKGLAYDMGELMLFMQKEPGDVFTPSMQCFIIYGPHYVFHGVLDENICQRLRCKNLKTRNIKSRYIYAAEGTSCGRKKWCIEGRCVSKRSK